MLKEIFNKDYFYNSSFSYDETTSARIWHRDSKATDFDNLDFTENHIIRFMFYFQDHLEQIIHMEQNIYQVHIRDHCIDFGIINFYFKPLKYIPEEMKAFLKGIKIKNFKFVNLLPVNIIKSILK